MNNKPKFDFYDIVKINKHPNKVFVSKKAEIQSLIASWGEPQSPGHTWKYTLRLLDSCENLVVTQDGLESGEVELEIIYELKNGEVELEVIEELLEKYLNTFDK